MKIIKLSVGEDVNLSPADFIGKLILERLKELYCIKTLKWDFFKIQFCNL